jgi:hypothetical protein
MLALSGYLASHPDKPILISNHKRRFGGALVYSIVVGVQPLLGRNMGILRLCTVHERGTFPHYNKDLRIEPVNIVRIAQGNNANTPRKYSAQTQGIM